MVRRYEWYNTGAMREVARLSETVPWDPLSNPLGPTRLYLVLSVVRSPCIRWHALTLLRSQCALAYAVLAGSLVALATSGQPCVTLHPWHIRFLRATKRPVARSSNHEGGRESLAHAFLLRSALSLAHVYLLRLALSLAHVFLLRFALSLLCPWRNSSS